MCHFSRVTLIAEQSFVSAAVMLNPRANAATPLKLMTVCCLFFISLLRGAEDAASEDAASEQAASEDAASEQKESSASNAAKIRGAARAGQQTAAPGVFISALLSRYCS